MKKLLSAVILHALLLPSIKAQSKLFDQQVQLKTCNISIEANYFIATTFIEMEFYNPKDEEVEGYQGFSLNRGQVISAFQLDLNGKYRDGSIEERWKANNAYNSIVGKRIDPAILQMNNNNNYSLRIYPIPAHSSRKVTMTIDQLMVEEGNKLNYQLPLNFSTNTEIFHLKINFDNRSLMPVCNKGLLGDRLFAIKDNNAALDIELKDIILNRPISFSIPLIKNTTQICISKQNGIAKFLMRISTDLPQNYKVKPTSISVFWDVSASAGSRDIKKELDFLERYISLNKITTTTITLFNQKILNTVVMDSRTKDFNVLRNYLSGYRYSGATTLGNLDFSETKADAILLFSDGHNSFGKAMPKPATVQVNCIVSTQYNYNQQQLHDIIGASGGSIINLCQIKPDSAVKLIGHARNFLMKYTSAGLSVKLNEKFPMKLASNMLLSGTFENKDHLLLLFGNSGSVNKTESIFLSVMDTCSNALYNKVQMLKSYDSVVYDYNNWQDMVYFGLKEKVVTAQTSFLVLERIEDYIKYNIAPPKELEAECAEKNYVYKSEYKIRTLKVFSEQDALQNTVNNYNQYVKWWNSKAELINLNKIVDLPGKENNITKTGSYQNSKENFAGTNIGAGENKTNSIKEVIVTSAFGVKRTSRSTSSNTQFISAAQLNTIYGNDFNDALAGKIAGIQVRSQSSVALGRVSSIRLRGESAFMPGTGPIYVVDGTILPDPADININDIQDVTVLQGPSASALFGPEAANGAIVLTTKKARNWYQYPQWDNYKLKDAEDIEYMTVIKNTPVEDLLEVYAGIEKDYKHDAVFYFDMAEYFFEKKMEHIALEILFDGVEVCKGSVGGLKAVAFIFERWKKFNEAIKIYQDILENYPNDLVSKRNLALAYFQNGEFQKAVNTYYQILSSPDEDHYYYQTGKIKVMAMNEMNAVISLAGNCISLDAVNPNLVIQLPVDMRVTVECNNGYFEQVRITDPKGVVHSDSSQYSLSNQYKIRRYRNYYHDVNEYSIKNAVPGTYKISVNSYNQYYYAGKVPANLRVVIFRNFQKANQTMEVQHIVMDNQYGSVEVAEIKW